MPACPICGDLLTPDAKVCALCGTNLAAADTALAPPEASPFDEGLKWETLIDSQPRPAEEPTNPPMALPLGPPPGGTETPTGAPQTVVLQLDANSPPPDLTAPERPAAGTRCLVLYGADRKPLQYFPVSRDVTLIGRQDPLRGIFPHINLADWLDEAGARKVSRKHALVLHRRDGDRFFLRPLAGNTGTQVEQDMVEALKDYPLTPGTRLILGGAARFKFEVIS
jgi:hypothetical protein